MSAKQPFMAGKAGARKRVREAMQADREWDKQHGVKQGSPQDRAIDAAVRRDAERGDRR